MMTHTDYKNGTLTVRRTYPAEQQAVFDAWVETSQVQDWWGCADTTKVESTIEKEVGGRFEHVMTLRGEYQHHAVGVFTEYDPPKLIAYSVRAPEEGGGGEMHVRVEFKAVEGGTEVTLRHSGIPDEFSPVIADGWTAAFGKLFRFFLQRAQAA